MELCLDLAGAAARSPSLLGGGGGLGALAADRGPLLKGTGEEMRRKKRDVEKKNADAEGAKR